MAQTYYSTGTISVSNGGTTVTGVGTKWVGVIFVGDLLHLQGLVAVVTADATSDTSLAIAAWAGTTVSGVAYKILFASDAVRQSERARQLLEELSTVQANGRGLFYTFDTTTTDADPGAGNLRLNNATIGSATAAYLDNLDADGAAVSTILDTWDDGGSSGGRGQLWLRSIADPAIFHAFNVTGSVVDGTGYRKLTLSYIGGSGVFVASDEIMAMFLPTGAAGTTGTDGGIVLTFSSTTSGDPGAGFFRLNNATHASATALLIDNTDGASGTISGLIDTWDDSTATIKGTVRIISTGNPAIWRVYDVSAVVDSTGFRTVTVAHVASNGTLANGTECSLFFSRTGNNGTNGVDGAGLFTRVRVVDTTGATPSTAYENGDTVDGVVLATNDLVLRATSGGNASDGVYVVPSSGAASRATAFDTYNEHPGAYFSVMEGAVNADTLWRCTSNLGGTLDSTALVIAQFSSGLPTTAASSSGPASIQFHEDTDNGTNKATLSAPSALGADISVTLPSASGELPILYPGAVVQSVRATPYTTNTTTTAVIPADDTIPQNTEGTQVLTASITPKFSNSKIVAVACLNATPNGAGRTSVFAMFRDSVANAFAATETFSGDGVGVALSLEGEFSFGDTSSHTISVRIGPGAAGTLAFNGLAAGRLLGGTMAMTLELREIRV